MSSISPIKDWGSRLLFVTPGSSWREVIERLLMDVEEGLGSTKLVEFVEDIARLPIANRLYPQQLHVQLGGLGHPEFSERQWGVARCLPFGYRKVCDPSHWSRWPAGVHHLLDVRSDADV